MKKTASYFGNRFKSSIRGFRSRRASKISVVPSTPPPAPAEFELLENRILLSGLTDGTKVLKKLSYIDADGDQVRIGLTGKLSASAGFQVTDLGNGFDVGEINLVGLTDKNSLVITVTPKKVVDSDRITSNQIWTPGYTNIGSIVAQDQTNDRGTNVLGADGLRNIGLNGVVVSNINVPETNIVGAITVGLGSTQFVDRINSSSPEAASSSVGWNPGAGYIDLYNVTANSIGRIIVEGGLAPAQNVANPMGSPIPGYTPTNDIVGSISVVGDLGGIQGVRSTLSSNISVGGNMGTVQVAKFTGNIAAEGDLTLIVPEDFNGTVFSGGHINLGFASGKDIGGKIIGGAGISGLLPSLTDGILVTPNFKGSIINTSTETDFAKFPGAGIADIVSTGANADFDVISGNKIGNIEGVSFTGMNVVAGSAGIGNITANAGELGGTFTSAGNIGKVSVVGGPLSGTFTAAGSINDISATTIDKTAGITGNFTAGTTIGNVLANVISPDGKSAFSGTLNAGATIGTITINSASTTSDVALGGTVTAADGIGAILVTAATKGNALGSTINADFDGDNVGAIPSITVTNSGEGNGIGSANITAASIGEVGKAAITVNITSLTGGAGITGSTITAKTNTKQTTDSAVFFDNFGIIGDINVTSKSGDANAISNSNFNAGGAGKIGSITVNAESSAAAVANSKFNATNEPSQSEALQTSTIGTINITNTGSGGGLNSVDFLANDGVGNIAVTSVGSGAVNIEVDADYDVDEVGNVGELNITVSGVGADGWAYQANPDSQYNFISGASIGKINITVLNPDGGNAIDGAYAFATAGNIGDIVIDSKSTTATAAVIGAIFEADTNDARTSGGGIGNTKVTSASGGIAYSNFTADGTIGTLDVSVTVGEKGPLLGVVNGLSSAYFEATGFANGTTGAFTGGTIGAIKVSVAQTTTEVDNDIVANGILSSSFKAPISIGNIDVDVVASAAGANADATVVGLSDVDVISKGRFNATTQVTDGGTIGAVDVTVSATATGIDRSATSTGIANSLLNADENTKLEAFATIGAVRISSTASASASFAGSVAQSSGIAAGLSTSSISVGTSVAAVTVEAAATGKTITASNEALSLIGTGTGTPQVLGAISFGKLSNASNVALNFNGLTAVGNISVDAPGTTGPDVANLTLLGAGLNQLVSVGTITVDGTISSLGATLGTGAAGSKIGLVTVGTGVGNNFTFSFAQMNGIKAPGSGALAVNFLDTTTDITTAQAASGIGNTQGGITAILV